MNNVEKSEKLINTVNSIMIRHDWVVNGLKHLDRCYKGAASKGDTRGLLILGESGGGKSRLLEHFSRKYPSCREPEGLIVPIVKASILPKPTVKGLLETLLFQVDDPLYDKGTESVKTIRLITLLKSAQTKIIMLDEFQHFIDQGSHIIQHHVADTLKIIVEDAKVALVLTGLPYCKQVVQTNSQLKRRIKKPIVLPRFDWIDDYHRSQFISILSVLQKHMPEIELPDLENETMAFRFYCASGGLIGRVANILLEVIENAKDTGKWKITLPALARAANDASYDLPDGMNNPFGRKASTVVTKEMVELAKTIGVKEEVKKEYRANQKHLKASDVLRK